MAFKREISITLNLKSGDTLDFTGDQAQSVYQQMKDRGHGIGVRNGIEFVNADGKEEYIEFKCICGYVRGDITETEIPDRDCDPMDCIN